MDKKYLNDEFDRFFEFPTDDKSQVSSVSAKLFAEHIAYPILMDNAKQTTEIQAMREKLRVAESAIDYSLNAPDGVFSETQEHAMLSEALAKIRGEE